MVYRYSREVIRMHHHHWHGLLDWLLWVLVGCP